MKKIIALIIWIIASDLMIASVGEVQQARGSVHLLRNTKTLLVKNHFKLELKDTLFTGKDGWASVRLSDNTRITVGKNSRLVIRDYLYDKSSKSKVSLGFTKGIFRTITGAIGKVSRKKFKIHTPTATIGIRGTDFYVQISSKREQIICRHGTVVFWKNGREYLIPAGHQILSDLISHRLTSGKTSTNKINRIKKNLKVDKRGGMPEKNSELRRRSHQGVLHNNTSRNKIAPHVQAVEIESVIKNRATIEERLHEQITADSIQKIEPTIQYPCDDLPH